MKTIGIIGAGFSGTMCAIQLMKQATSSLIINLIEKKDVARGQAYADIIPDLILNVRADQMGAFPEDVGHFYKWLQDNQSPAAPTDFISRKIYGDYINELLSNTIEETKALVKVNIIKDQVIDINPDKKEIFFQDQSPLQVDQIVLALGLESPTQFNFSNLKDSDGPVTIIGTGLSMIDVITYLASINYQGKITAVSRRGKIPHSHKFYEASVPRPVYDFSKDRTLKHVLHVVKKNLQTFEWRLVIDGLRPHTQLLWANWSIRERGQFLRYLRALWDTHRHRISPLHQQMLENLKQSGKLEIVATHYQNYSPATSTVINCYGLSLTTNKLAQKLIQRNVVAEDTFQLGLESQLEWLHTIGPLKRGQLWESTAVPELRVQARDLASVLLK